MWQRLFQRLGFVVEKMVLCPRGSSASLMLADLEALFASNLQVIMRTAIRDQPLNSPRRSVSSMGEAEAFLASLDLDLTDVIAQEQLPLEWSCELYVTADAGLLEIVPGIWGTGANQLPDAIELRRDGARRPVRRRAEQWEVSSLDGTGQLRTVTRPPISDEQLGVVAAACQERWDVLDAIRRRLVDPFHLYFQTFDGGRVSWQNVREMATTLELDKVRSTVPGPYFVVRQRQDVERWDGAQALLFAVSAERSALAALIDCVDALKARGATSVAVANGVLSHQAILLREAGMVTTAPDAVSSERAP